MSKLVELLEGSGYTRLDKIGGSFSVRKQSNTEDNIKQQTAVNFVDTKNEIQDEFTVQESKNSLTGISKAAVANNTKFTPNALDRYSSLTTTPKLIYINENPSKKVHRYTFPVGSAVTSYSLLNGTAPGIALNYK